MVIIAMDAADVASTADIKDGVGVACCRRDGDTLCDTADTLSLTAVVSTPTPFDDGTDLLSHVVKSTTSGRLLTVDGSCTAAPSVTTQLPALVLFLNTGTGGLLVCAPSGKLLFLKLDGTVSGKPVSVATSVAEPSFISNANVRLSQTVNSAQSSKHTNIFYIQCTEINTNFDFSFISKLQSYVKFYTATFTEVETKTFK